MLRQHRLFERNDISPSDLSFGLSIFQIARTSKQHAMQIVYPALFIDRRNMGSVNPFLFCAANKKCLVPNSAKKKAFATFSTELQKGLFAPRS